MQIETVRGPVESSELGVTLAHEHIAIFSDGVPTAFPGAYDRDEAVASAIAQLGEAAALGVDSIVDLTVLGLGRDIGIVSEVAAAVPVHVVVATGIYTFDRLPHYFEHRSVEDMAALFVGDIVKGIGDTDVRAAVLKCATDQPGITAGVDKVLRACARAHQATGVPVNTHTDAATRRGLEQVEVFAEEGVDLRSVVIGHCGDSDDLDYLTAIADRGCVLGMDRFGIDHFLPLDRRCDVVAEMWRRGYGDRMVLSHDCVCTLDWFPPERGIGGRGMTLIHQDVLPRLADAGMGDDDIAQLLVHTPRRVLEGAR